MDSASACPRYLVIEGAPTSGLIAVIYEQLSRNEEVERDKPGILTYYWLHAFKYAHRL